MRLLIPAFNLCLLFLSLNAFGQNAPIDPVLLNKSGNTPMNAILVFKSQADLTKANTIRGKSQKTNYVFKQLNETAEKSQKKVLSYLREAGVQHRPYYICNCISVKTDLSVLKELSRFEELEKIIEDAAYTMLPYETDRSVGDRAIEWGVSRINAPQVWQMGHTGQGVVIGGQDTGYEWNHPAIINQYRGWNGSQATHNFNWHDAIYTNAPQNSGTNPCGYNLSVPCDDNNHGTHTAGTMTGDDGGSNQIGVAPGAKWIGCRNMERGWGLLSTYMDCFEWFLAPYAYGDIPANGNPAMSPHVINNSWYCPPEEGCNSSNWSVMESVVNALKAAGTVVVVSAGNSGPNCGTVTGPPAIFQNSFSVGATSNTDAIAGFSSRGPVTIDNSNRLKPNVSAPGVNVRSCIRNNLYASYNGTSMAGPHVAGAVALIISANPDLAGEVELIETILEQTAFQAAHSQSCGSTPAGTWPNNTFGYGIVDVLAAVNMAKAMHVNRRVNISDTDIIFNQTGTGPVVKNTNNQYYRMTVDNSGNVNLLLISSPSTQKSKLENSSVDLSISGSGIVLRAPNGQYYKVTTNNSGNPVTAPVSSLPNPNLSSSNADLVIDSADYGLVLKSPSGKCFLWTLQNNGQLLVREIVCMD